jgi:hypothetical protein
MQRRNEQENKKREEKEFRIIDCNSIKIQFSITRSFANAKFLHAERNITIRNNMSNDDTKEEAFFSERYAQELRKKKQDSNSYQRNDALNDEKRRVNQPGIENTRSKR